MLATHRSSPTARAHTITVPEFYVPRKIEGGCLFLSPTPRPTCFLAPTPRPTSLDARRQILFVGALLRLSVCVVCVCVCVRVCVLCLSVSRVHTQDLQQCCNVLQRTATHCNTLQHTTTHCNKLQYTSTLFILLQILRV